MAIPGIHEIQTLATKYSKTQLQKMAQMGLIDSTKAVMAGMMIDRISKQNMAPPATTVAEDALAPPPPQEAPQGPPQMGPGGAPPEQSAGIAALQSNIPEMAGGGIVAFADGGDIPSYKDEGLVSRENFPRISPSQQRAMDRSEVRLPALVGELQTVRGMLPTATGKDKTDLQRIIQGLEKEIRDIKGTVQPVDLPFISSAAAGELPAKAIAATGTGDGKTSSAFGRAYRNLFPEASEQQKAAGQGILEGNVAYDKQIGVLRNKIANLGGPLAQQTPQQQAEYEQAQKDLAVLTEAKGNLARDVQTTPYYKGLPPIEAPKASPAAPDVRTGPEVFQPRVDVAPPADQVAPRERVGRGAPDELTKITPEQIEVPAATSLGAERARREEAYKEAGVDTNMYKEMMAEVASRKEGGAKKREQALGMALMMTGLGLAGARRGKEFETLSGAGRQALAQFQGTMDNIVANEDKIDNMVRELKMAENNYRKTGAESDLARMRAREDKIEAINAKNIELKNVANYESKKLAVQAYVGGKSPPAVEMVERILEDMRVKNPNATFQDALKVANQASMKGGEISPTTAFKEYNDLKIADMTGKFKKEYPEFKDYWADIQKGMGSIAPQGPAMPTAEHIKQLQANPNMRTDFDAKFGPGSAARILGK